MFIIIQLLSCGKCGGGVRGGADVREGEGGGVRQSVRLLMVKSSTRATTGVRITYQSVMYWWP